MTFGIVIASYGYGHLAAHAIETVLDQSRPFDKIWFVDDAAQDCTHLPALYPGIEYELREENLGTVRNFHDMLMTKVDTDYVMFLGADNWLRADTLQQLSAEAVRASIVTYDIMVVGSLKNEIYNRHPSELHPVAEGIYWTRCGSYHGSMMYDTVIAREAGGYAYKAMDRTMEDMVLFQRMLLEGASVTHVRQALLYYRRHPQNFNPC